jgi:hypothetical protein
MEKAMLLPSQLITAGHNEQQFGHNEQQFVMTGGECEMKNRN